ncbi:MAG: hypothetical protein HFJ75_01610 [Eggerthellaceae bacterium]|nr:hypothetical protein [Eggerthellaceae bacterium]
MSCPKPCPALSPTGAVAPVGRVLGACDPQELCLALLRFGARWDIDPAAVGRARIGPLTAVVEGSLRAVRALTPPAVALVPDAIVVPWESFRPAISGVIERRLGAAQVPLAALGDVARVLSEAPAPGWGPRPSASMLRVLRATSPADPWSPAAMEASLAPWGSMPWPVVLGLPLWIPAGQPPEDALQVAAALLWALTQRGFLPRADGGPRAVAGAPPPGGPPPPRVPLSAGLVGLLNCNAWLCALRGLVESARVLEVL